mmetsp:Transcript_70729/g.142414  ORF Transcript_70729/g.142414 Transcript_70729/m.142414 type:complete len:257 (-) Transcript_70729:153-923(-)
MREAAKAATTLVERTRTRLLLLTSSLERGGGAASSRFLKWHFSAGVGGNGNGMRVTEIVGTCASTTPPTESPTAAPSLLPTPLPSSLPNPVPSAVPSPFLSPPPSPSPSAAVWVWLLTFQCSPPKVQAEAALAHFQSALASASLQSAIVAGVPPGVVSVNSRKTASWVQTPPSTVLPSQTPSLLPSSLPSRQATLLYPPPLRPPLLRHRTHRRRSRPMSPVLCRHRSRLPCRHPTRLRHLLRHPVRRLLPSQVTAT